VHLFPPFGKIPLALQMMMVINIAIWRTARTTSREERERERDGEKAFIGDVHREGKKLHQGAKLQQTIII
jgi:hypothetical protein